MVFGSSWVLGHSVCCCYTKCLLNFNSGLELFMAGDYIKVVIAYPLNIWTYADNYFQKFRYKSGPIEGGPDLDPNCMTL